MHSSLLDILIDPVSRTPLHVETHETGGGAHDGDPVQATLRGGDGRSYPVIDGIPRFVTTEDAGQQQTGESFGFKWQQQESYDSESFKTTYREWLVGKYGFESAEAMRGFFAGRKRIMDAGCGAGLGSAVWLDESWRGEGSAEWVGVDVSVAIDVARKRLGSIPGTHFVQADILNLPFREQSFDTIFSEGVLHHTPSTERAFKSLVPLLVAGGEIMFYVYRKKSPIREFTDDYVRDIISPLPPAEAWELLRPLTKLGQALAELHVEVEVPEDVDLLGIKAGRHDVQRLIYWHFAKLFWNEELPAETNHHINFDWYHPRYAHRQTEADIRRWCDEAGLSISYFHEQESGYTIRAVKNSHAPS
jgi:SAM-dependent methyltransferase/uncharacterized protein YbaR (Trm112 family)